MTDKKKFIIGSRGSKLSLAYANHVKNLLIKLHAQFDNNSIEIYREIEPQVKIKFGEHSAFYIQVLGNLGSLVSSTGNFKEAINIKNKTLKIQEKVFGKFHLLAIFQRQDLITTYCNFNKINAIADEIIKTEKAIFISKEKAKVTPNKAE